MKDLSKQIIAYALHNAIEYGKTSPDRILPKLFQHGLEKDKIQEILPQIQEIAKQVNSLKQEERQKQFETLKNLIKTHEEKPRELPELPNAGKKMVFRLAPFPSGALHIGNAKTYLLNALYAEKYKAKTLLIMDDTIGSEEKQPIKEAYGLIEQGFQWLNVKYKKPIIHKSERLKIYYNYALDLIKKGKAYVCHCPQEELRKNRASGLECGCRQFPPEMQLGRWKQMFKAKEGSAILRIKTSMQHPNPAFRDRVLLKISDREHPRVGKKYRVWPTLEMSWAIDDHLLGITHILRGNDLAIESEMEKYLWDIFRWKHPEIIHTGLAQLEGIKISKSKAQKEVVSGEYIGWDDPRTWSLQSLKRRGILAESIREFVKEIGLNKQDVNVPIDALYAINRKLIDKSSLRYSFAENPQELKIANAPAIKSISIPIHPDKKETRKIELGKIFISHKDSLSFKSKEVRLLHLFNIKLNKDNSAEFTSLKNKDIPKINWVTNPVKVKILMPEGNWLLGYAEEAIKKLKPGQVIQFERFGFCKFDKFNKKANIYEFWFSHK